MLARLRHPLQAMAMAMETQTPVRAKAAVVMVVVVTATAMATALVMHRTATQATHRMATLATQIQAMDAVASARTATSSGVQGGPSSSALDLSKCLDRTSYL